MKHDTDAVPMNSHAKRQIEHDAALRCAENSVAMWIAVAERRSDRIKEACTILDAFIAREDINEDLRGRARSFVKEARK